MDYKENGTLLYGRLEKEDYEKYKMYATGDSIDGTV
jgi:hypothetical protein